MKGHVLVWVILVTITLTVDLLQHDKPKTGTHDFRVSVCSIALMALLLWWGGFFE